MTLRSGAPRAACSGARWLVLALLLAACGREVAGPASAPSPGAAHHITFAEPTAPGDVVLSLEEATFVGHRASVARHDLATGIVTHVRAFGGRGGLAADARALFAADDERGVLGMWPVGGKPQIISGGLVAPVGVTLSGDAVLVRERDGRVVRVPRPDALAPDEMLAPGAPPARP